jgi:hypothetical protein
LPNGPVHLSSFSVTTLPARVFVAHPSGRRCRAGYAATAILVSLFRNRGTINVAELDDLSG